MSKHNKIAILVLVLTVVAFFAPAMFSGETFYAFDLLLSRLPWLGSGQEVAVHNKILRDPIELFYLNHLMIQNDEYRSFLPFWNPHIFLGIPHYPNTHPITLPLLGIVDASYAHDIVLFLNLCGSGIFLFLYLRKLDLRVEAALAGAITWMLNGHLMVWFEFEQLSTLALSLSATLYFFELCLRRATVLRVLLLAMAIGYGTASYHYHSWVYQILFLIVYALFRVFKNENTDTPTIKDKLLTLRPIVVATLISIVVAANFLTNMWEMPKSSQREGYAVSELAANTGSITPLSMPLAVFPNIYGSPLEDVGFFPKLDPKQTYNNFNELCFYSGVFAIMMALVCSVQLRRNSLIPFFGITAIVAMLMATGGPLYWSLSGLVPGLNLSTPTRVLYIYSFSISIIAALGLHLLLNPKLWTKNKVRALVLLYVALVAVCAAVTYLAFNSSFVTFIVPHLNLGFSVVPDLIVKYYVDRKEIFLIPSALIALFAVTTLIVLKANSRRTKSAIACLMVIAATADLFWFGFSFNTSSDRALAYPNTAVTEFLENQNQEPFRVVKYTSFGHNGLIPYKVDEFGGYNSFYPRRVADLAHIAQYGRKVPLPSGDYPNWLEFERSGFPLFNLLNIKYLLLRPDVQVNSSSLPLQHSSTMNVYENLEVLPRAWFVPSYEQVFSERAALTRISEFGNHEYRNTAVVEERPEKAIELFDERTLGGRFIPTQGSVSLLESKHDFWKLEVNAHKSGLVVLSNGFHRNWKATVNGVEAKVLKANLVMQAVAVDKGKSIVELKFEPTLVMFGAVTSMLAWSLLVLVVVALLMWQRVRIKTVPA